MKIYHYDEQGVYTHTSDARMSPLEPGVPLVPARATLVAPQNAPAGSVPVWLNEAWQLRIDLRGTEYWLPNGKQHKVEKVGDSLPPEAITVAPPSDDPRLRWNGAAWAVPDEVKAQEAAREAAITRLKERGNGDILREEFEEFKSAVAKLLGIESVDEQR